MPNLGDTLEIYEEDFSCIVVYEWTGNDWTEVKRHTPQIRLSLRQANKQPDTDIR